MPKGLTIKDFNGVTTVRLYNTDILVMDLNNNTLTFNSGGWYTNHTKKCINLGLNGIGYKFNYKVFQKASRWFIETPEGAVPFQDNLTLKAV